MVLHRLKNLGKRLSLCLNVSFLKTKMHVPYFFCSIWLQLVSMRVGGQPAPELCCCSLCLAVGRLSVFCHSGELGPGALGFATDRVRILYNELLDIRARAPPPPRPGGVIGVPPPVAAGEGGSGTNPGGGPDLGVAAPEGRLGGETGEPLSTPGASEVKTEQTEPEVPPPSPVKGKSPPESKGEQGESARCPYASTSSSSAPLALVY